MANFEEYRQPWETGPHWELKREFMEKFENDYPLDRLLCLAQAYSNIELLHCSYPEPVMREVSQLSYQLQGCKRFRAADADLERRRKEKAEMQPRKDGKRNLDDEVSNKLFKFIKFRSPEVASAKSSNESDKNSNNFNHCDIVSTNNSRTLVVSEDFKKNSFSEDAYSNSANTPSNSATTPSNSTTTPSNSTTTPSNSTTAPSNSNIIFSLNHSPDFALMQKLAAAIPKKTTTPIESIEIAIELSGLENEIKYVFLCDKMSVTCCQFFVGNTLIATGRDATERKAKERALQYVFEILNNLSNLPYKTLEDIKQELKDWKVANRNTSILWSEMQSSDLQLKLKILRSQLSEMLKNPKHKDLYLILSFMERLLLPSGMKNIPPVQHIQKVAAMLKCDLQLFYFHFGEDPDSLLHKRIFHCDFVIKNIFICHTKASSKKKAKGDAAAQGFHFLTNFIENFDLGKQDSQEQVPSLKIHIDSSKPLVSDINKIQKEHMITFMPNNGTDSLYRGDSENTPKLFRVNHRLLANSRNQQLIIYDLSETSCYNNAGSVIFVTASRCKKNLNYVRDEVVVNSQRIFRCFITLNKEEIGRGQGFTDKEAKSNAAENALQFLQKNVYTVKVKNEIGESFIISRSHVINAENPSSVLGESNVGCKMMKLMGWTGGGIGKKSGITEPIVAKDHRFGHGLGFSDNKSKVKSFKQKVDSLLKDYSLSNTTSDLIFSTEFTKEERKDIHQLAVRYNLSSTSRGKDQQRQLFIGRKLSPMELLEHLIESGGSTPKYELEDRSIFDRKAVSQ